MAETEPSALVGATPVTDIEHGLAKKRSQGRIASLQNATNTHSAVPKLSSKDPSNDRDDRSSLSWNLSHPCYPHANPHVPISSPLYPATRIVRIPRDWLIAGDLAPSYSNTYPEILEPWISEQEFRSLILGINQRLRAAFDPFTRRAWVDIILGFMTGWLWDDFGMTGAKRCCADAEHFIERWNSDRASSQILESEKETGSSLVQCISLRKTGYLNLDIQIPDPHLAIEESESQKGGNRTSTAPAPHNPLQS